MLALATVLSALMSGFFFSYSFSVNLGLSKLNNKEYLTAMQNINKEVLNPIFFISFFGALIFLVISSTVYFKAHSPKSYLILCACISYVIGVLGITAIGNIPLNTQLALFDITKESEVSLQNMRTSFETRWVFWNKVRTLSSFITLVCLIISLIYTSID